MNDYSIPKGASALIGLGNQFVTGLTQYGTALAITQVTAAQMQSTVTAFANAESAFGAARAGLKVASAAFVGPSEALYNWLLGAKNVLTVRFGVRWNTNWAQAGFTAPTTQIPRNFGQETGLALGIINCLKKNTTWQAQQVNFTSTIGTAVLTAAQTAQAALFDARVAVKMKGEAWQAPYDALVKMETNVVKLLQVALGPDDPRWSAFGLQQPSAPRTPVQPQGLTVQWDEVAGAVLLACEPAMRAERYRWRMLLVEAGVDYRLVASTTEPYAPVANVAQPGQLVRFIVQGVNGGSQGVASESVDFTIPLLRTAVPALQPVRELALGHAGKGNGNGHSNGRTARG